jgi:hypothetical protein
MEETLTRKQQEALHLWFRQLSEVLQEMGLDMRQVMTLPIKPTEFVVKEDIFKPIMEKMFGYHSTTELKKKKDIDDIIDVIRSMFSDMKSDVVVPPFPSEEEIANQQLYGKKV